MAPALVPSIAAAALPHARAARSRLVRAVRARVGVAASAGDDAEVTPERRLQLEKADALREEYDGVSTRARRLLTRGGRLAEKIDELTAAAERAMTLGADRDEDQARRLLRERAQVKEALDRTIARAEVLKELARKIEMAIIVYAGEIADESAEGAVAAPSANAKDVAPGSLEAEFASLEINLLERAFAASGAAASETAPTRDETLGATATKREADASPVAAPRDVPGWWRDASDEELLPPKRNEKTSGGAPSAEKPLDALLSLDRARVSSVGVRPSDAVRLRVACAAHGAEDVARSKRLEGGKRDTAFRAGVEAACAAVEAEEGRVEKEKELWRSLGGQEPLRFLSDLARDLGLRPTRAGALVTEAVVRRVEKTLVQCAAHARAGDWDDARGESVVLARTLVAFAAAAASPEDRERVALVALRTQRQLREDERREVLALFSDEGRESESVREVIRLALGLEEERE